MAAFVSSPFILRTTSTFITPSPTSRPRLCPHPIHHVSIPCMSTTSPDIHQSSSSERILWATNISKSHDAEKFLFRDENITIHRGDKIGILGPNGSGKTSLLHILARASTSDTGNVSLRKGIISALVAQTLPTDLDPHLTVTSAVLQLASRYASTQAIRAALRHAEASRAVTLLQMSSNDIPSSQQQEQRALKLLSEATSYMDSCPGAWQVDSRVSSALSQLSLPPDAQLSLLSGGQKRRVGIAAAIVVDPDIIFLDEVTNHLSSDAIQFLEQWLCDSALTVVAISHDRAFVNRVCTSSIWELEAGELYRYSAPYDAFLSEKNTRLESQSRRAQTMRKTLMRQLEWMKRQPKARGTKNRSRVNDTLQLRDQVQLEENIKRKRDVRLQGLATPSTRLGGDVVSLQHVTLRRGGRTLLRDFSYTFERGERVGIVGPNGVGKSSVLRAIAQLADVDDGVVHVGDTVVFGYFDQEGIDVSARLSEASVAAHGGARVVEDLRVVDYVTELLSRFGDVRETPGLASSVNHSKNSQNSRSDTILEEDKAYALVTDELERLSASGSMRAHADASGIRTNRNILGQMHPIALLDHFGFARDRQHGFVRHLSGGERRRLQLIGLLLKNANFLILDEVSNDLDVNTLSTVEEVLEDFTGVLVLCSHDRFMLDRLVDHLLVLEGNGDVRVVEGKFSDYLQAEKETKVKAKARAKKHQLNNYSNDNDNTQDTQKKRKLSFKERKEYESLEHEIEKLQEEYDMLCEQLATQSQQAGFEKAKEWSERLATLDQMVNDKMDRWLKLAQLEE